MAMTLQDVDAFATSLPGVTIGASWGNKTWQVKGHGFAWERPLNKADIKRYGNETPPSGEILAVRVESLDAKDALLAMGLPGFFTIEHFNGYAAVLIELRKARAKEVKAALQDAFGVMAARPPKSKSKTKNKAKAKTKPKAQSR